MIDFFLRLIILYVGNYFKYKIVHLKDFLLDVGKIWYKLCMTVSFLDDILFMAIDCQNNKRLLTKTWRNLEFVLSVKNSMQETRSITREEEIMKADRDSRIWLKDNPSNVRALQRTSLIISWLKTLSYRRKNPSINNPTAKSCKN